MVQVRLVKEWTDGDGGRHDAGDTITVDEATATDLKTKGIADWAGPTGGQTDWAGPTGSQP